VRAREDAEVVERLLDAWEVARKRRVWGYVGQAWNVETLQFTAEQIQLADQRQHAVLEIARAAGIDPEDLGVSTTSRTYQNSEQRRQDLIDFTLMPYASAIEQRLTMGDVTPRGYEVKVNFDGFLRADTKTRYEAHKIALDSGFETIDEVRELEDRPKLARISRPVPMPVPTQEGVPGANGNGNGTTAATGANQRPAG
jgi:HK97 family phage portal protein